MGGGGGGGCRRKHSSPTMCPGSDPKGYAVACVHPPLPLKPNRSCSRYIFWGEGGGGGGGALLWTRLAMPYPG